MRKKYNKYTSISDRLPFIVVAVIIGLSLLFIFIFRAKFPLSFFSGSNSQQEVQETTEYSIYINSPSNDQVFKFANENENVPIEIKSKDIENVDYKLKLLINDEVIRTFNSPPFEYNWNPDEPGEYEIKANLVDDNDDIISASNTVNFTVEYSGTTLETVERSIDIEEKKKLALEQTDYRTQNGAPVFSFKCYTPPVIDGVLDEWEIYDKAQIANPTIKKENFVNISDCSGIIYTSWDDEAFYFAVTVTDDVFNQSFTGNQINNGDSITLVFDTDLAGDFNIPFYNSDDSHIDFSPGSFSGIPPEAFLYFPSKTPVGIEIKSTQINRGYILEAKLPWENFVSYGPQDTAVIGFTASIFDTDNLESTELAVSSSTQFEIKNITTLGTLVFIDGGDLLGTESSDSSEETTAE
ncbi:MAG: hypothetical protein M1308_18580 [Actinobacteria bacterium]|nr:hypothetical protein [Actinomycetota bacterium]